ncbi:hypothetical protein MKX01_003789, partial [Papaver californicum]
MIILKDTTAPLLSPETAPRGDPQLHSKPMGFSQNHLLGAFIFGGGIAVFIIIGFVLLICSSKEFSNFLNNGGQGRE